MPLELHISGPGLDVRRRLEAGEPALILGRDADCAVCLPDPERNISRRHLSLWNENEQLHFHVLSVINGIDTAAGELPPGARGVLAAGEVLGLSAFRIVLMPSGSARPAPPADIDPWTEFERAAQMLVPEAETVPGMPEEDPFGDWGFQSTFGPGAPGGSLRADGLQAAGDLRPFFSGLGLESSRQAAFTQGELEAMGRITRIALQGLLQSLQSADAMRRDARPEERTTPEPREPNPLRLDTPLETKLYYLFGGHAAAAGFMAPDRAVAQVAGELAAHEQALAEAVREMVQKAVEEFDPEALKKRLLGGGARLFESARAWDAFARDYAQRSDDDSSWAQQLLDRHFARAYARALVRAKRNTSGPS